MKIRSAACVKLPASASATNILAANTLATALCPFITPGRSDMPALVTYHAQPGSDSEERLRLLASITTPEPDSDIQVSRRRGLVLLLAAESKITKPEPGAA